MADKDQQPPPKNGQNHEQQEGQDEEQQDESIVVIDSPTAAVRVPNPQQQNNNTINSSASAPFPADLDDDDDDIDYAFHQDSDIDLLESSSALAARDNNQLPLIPTDFSSILEAMQNLTAVFDSRYGAQHAPFYQGSLQNAISDAFEAPGHGIEERRPLAIYLHNDNSVAAHIFAQEVMSSVEVSGLMRHQFVTWAWDVSQFPNRQQLYEWMGVCGLAAVADSIRPIPASKYPLLILLVKERSQISQSTLINGHDTVSSTLQKLMQGLDHYQMIKQQDTEEERNRMEREQFRQEQVYEYERGLAADRAKQEELKRKRQEEIEEEQRRQDEEAEKQSHRLALATILPSEPSAEDPEAITVRLRLPHGEQAQRRFRHDESVEMLLIYVETLGYERTMFRLWTSDVPKKEVTKLDTSKTFAQLGWSKREMVTIEEM